MLHHNLSRTRCLPKWAQACTAVIAKLKNGTNSYSHSKKCMESSSSWWTKIVCLIRGRLWKMVKHWTFFSSCCVPMSPQKCSLMSKLNLDQRLKRHTGAWIVQSSRILPTIRQRPHLALVRRSWNSIASSLRTKSIFPKELFKPRGFRLAPSTTWAGSWCSSAPYLGEKASLKTLMLFSNFWAVLII